MHTATTSRPFLSSSPRTILVVTTLTLSVGCGTTDFSDDVSRTPDAWIEEIEAQETKTPTTQDPPSSEVSVVEEEPGKVDPEEPVRSEEPVVVSDAALASCDFELRWWNPVLSQQLPATAFGWSPDQSLIFGTGTDYLSSWQMARARDGEPMLYGTWPVYILDVDRDWRRALVRRGGPMGVSLTEVILLETGETLMQLEEDTSYPYDQLDLSEDGEVLVGHRCESHEDGTSTENVNFWSAGSGSFITGYEQRRDMSCNWWESYASNLSINDDASVVAFANLSDPSINFEEDSVRRQGAEIEVFNRHGDHLIRREILLDDIVEGEETLRDYMVPLAALEFHPDQKSLSVVDMTGKHYFIDTTKEDLTVTRRARRGAFISNWNSYLPSIPTSAMAWSKDAKLFASVNEEAEVEISTWLGQGGEIKQVLRAPELPGDMAGFIPAGQPNAPVNVAFSPDGKAFMVAFTQGVGVWGCADQGSSAPVDPVVKPLHVELETSVLVSGQFYPFEEIDHEEVNRSSYLKTLRVVVDGKVEQLIGLMPGVEPTFRLYVAGSHEVYFEVDDGVNLWRSEIQQVTVLAPR